MPVIPPIGLARKKQNAAPPVPIAETWQDNPKSMLSDALLSNDIIRAQDATEVDTLRRKEYEAHAALQQGLAAEQDPAKRLALKAEYDKAVAGLVSPRSSVMRAWQGDLATAKAKAAAQFNIGEREHAIRLVQQDAKVNLQSALDKGDLPGHAVQVQKLVQTGILGKAEGEKMIADAPAVSALSAAERKINTGDVAGAIADLEGAETKGWSDESVKGHRELLDFAKGRLVQAENATYQAGYAALAARNMRENPTAAEALGDSRAVVADIRAKLDAGQLNPHQANELLAANRAIDERLETQVHQDAALAKLDREDEYEGRLLDLYALPEGQREVAAKKFKRDVAKSDLSNKKKLDLSEAADTLAAKGVAPDFETVNALSEEVTAFEKHRQGGPALALKINQAVTAGKFGTGKAANTMAEGLLKRIVAGKFDANRAAVYKDGGIRDNFKYAIRDSDENATQLHLFDLAFDDWLEKHPDATPDQAFTQGKMIAALYAEGGGGRAEQLRTQGTMWGEPAARPKASYPTATNRATGQRMMFKDGKWQPL